MADLIIAPASGDQGTTQNPQTAPKPAVGASTQSGGIQPGTPKDVLNGQTGVSLQPVPLTTVNLNAPTAAATTTSSQPAAKPASHHINPAILGISIVLVLLAAGLFLAISRSAKNTTD